MPVSWTIDNQAPEHRSGAFLRASGRNARYRLLLTPSQALSERGFATFIAMTALFFLLPLLAVLGSPVLWGLLPFLMLVLWGIWHALRRNRATLNRISEEVTLTRDVMELIRHAPGHPVRNWRANPYWVRLHLHTDTGPVENYLTLSGGTRDVEIGAFLSPDERAQLHDDLQSALASLR